jgi:hypothetical protein
MAFPIEAEKACRIRVSAAIARLALFNRFELAAIRRASSRVRKLAAVRRPSLVLEKTYASACPALVADDEARVVVLFDRPWLRETAR